MEIEEIQKKVKNGEYEISFHAEKERYAEDITIQNLETAIFNGEILEDYPDDLRGSSWNKSLSLRATSGSVAIWIAANPSGSRLRRVSNKKQNLSSAHLR